MPTKYLYRCVIVMVVALTNPVVHAASHCKGMAENACSTDQSCSWVKGYTRKDGRAVSSHCRIKRSKVPMKLSSKKTSE